MVNECVYQLSSFKHKFPHFQSTASASLTDFDSHLPLNHYTADAQEQLQALDVRHMGASMSAKTSALQGLQYLVFFSLIPCVTQDLLDGHVGNFWQATEIFCCTVTVAGNQVDDVNRSSQRDGRGRWRQFLKLLGAQHMECRAASRRG